MNETIVKYEKQVKYLSNITRNYRVVTSLSLASKNMKEMQCKSKYQNNIFQSIAYDQIYFNLTLYFMHNVVKWPNIL